MDFLPRYPHLSILSFSPSLPVNGDGLRHLEEVEEVEEEMGLLGGRVVKFSKSVELYTQLCLKQEKKKKQQNHLKVARRRDAAVTFSWYQ